MRREPHPLSGTIYEQLADGTVKVQKSNSDSYGVFSWQGEWLEGDVTQADPMMLLYIGGPDLPETHEVFWMNAGSGIYADPEVPVDYTPGTHMAEMPRMVAGYSPDIGQVTAQGARSAVWEGIDFFLDNDRRPDLIPASFHLENPYPGGPKRINTDRFWKREFHDLEVEHIWKKTWQMACREDDIPGVGDYHVYQVANLSFLVVRTEAGILAHQNVCLHRGRLLKDCSGKGAKEFMCPYHGWAWHLDGSLKRITAEWDFPGVREDAAKLPEIKVATWAGFVFINPDPDAGSLEDFIGPVALDYYKKYSLENRYKQAHVQKIIRCNWKVVHEAFMESYHVIATHPHQMLLGGDLANTRYDVFGNWGRSGFLQPDGSPQRGIPGASAEERLAGWHVMADHQREFLRSLIGDEADGFSDAELNDGGSFNNLFPNLMPWGGFTRITFRFLPHGDNPDESIMDIMLLAPWPAGKDKPAPAKLRKLGADEPWTDAPELLSLSKITDQDVANVPSVHAGLKAKNPPYVWYSAYQESKIRAWHDLYDRALGLPDGTPAD